MSAIDIFITNDITPGFESLVKELSENSLVSSIFILGEVDKTFNIPKIKNLISGPITQTETIKIIAEQTQSRFCMLILNNQEIKLGLNALERFHTVATATDAGWLYADYHEITDNKTIQHPLIDYQKGSLRDDFNFGRLIFIRSSILKKVVEDLQETFQFAGIYQLRLAISRYSELVRIPEFLYKVGELDQRNSGSKIFDYVDPKNRNVQIEMEKAVTSHLKAINGYLPPRNEPVNFNVEFPVEASVIIPVKNREKTIADAIESVLIQKTGFPFNLIIVDNFSSDQTSEIIKKYQSQSSKIIHIIPERTDLGIGGCWEIAIQDKNCGKFAIQLDSDDLYKDENTLQKIVDTFYKEQCAMVIGSYQMTNFKLEEIPPGLIDHREWTDENGHNNALRINGLGAPRAFFTPILRNVHIPNVSYGEDYALGLTISRSHRIGRIYDSLYLCRRWEDNSDANLSIETMNKHNFYKDKLRTIELMARVQLMQKNN